VGRAIADRARRQGRGAAAPPGARLNAEPGDAYGELFRDHWRAAVAITARLTGDLDAAEDAVQEACALALVKWPAEGVPGNPRAWLVGVARHKARAALGRGHGSRPGLFAYPAQSNFSGVQHPLSWVCQAQGAGYDVLLDAAAFVPANRLDLAAVRRRCGREAGPSRSTSSIPMVARSTSARSAGTPARRASHCGPAASATRERRSTRSG
jgi:DNA-directed RNA polymerase specialized sigma24 family protein